MKTEYAPQKITAILSMIGIVLIALGLSVVAIIRTPFSPKVIAAPLTHDGKEAILPFDQVYRFLGRGRQSFAFVSSDGMTVLKFFNKDYFHVPWYLFALRDQDSERKKRELRKKYFSEGYMLAEQYLMEQTGLLYVHYGRTQSLPKVKVIDCANRVFTIDLNQVPFVLQRKGEPIYLSLQKIYESQGKEGLSMAIDAYLEILNLRIKLGIADGDHDIEHNYGFLDGKPFQLDPGRLYLRDLSDKNALAHEWWVGTYRLRKWLNQQYPDMISEEKWNLSF